MPSYESPLGNKNFNAVPLKEYTVEDESGYHQSNSQLNDENNIDFERKIQEERKLKVQGINKLSAGAKSRIEYLLGMTAINKDIKINNITFTLKTLKSSETREAIVEAAKLDGTIESPFEIRKQFLARSLVAIDGVNIYDFLGSSDLNDIFIFLEELDHNLLLSLYDEYLKITNSAKEQFSISTPEIASEVAEDLKK